MTSRFWASFPLVTLSVWLTWCMVAGDRIPLDCLHEEHGDCDPLEFPPMQAPCLFPNLQWNQQQNDAPRIILYFGEQANAVNANSKVLRSPWGMRQAPLSCQHLDDPTIFKRSQNLLQLDRDSYTKLYFFWCAAAVLPARYFSLWYLRGSLRDGSRFPRTRARSRASA